MNILYDMIHKHALATYTGPDVKAENYQFWVKHWFASAISLRDSMRSEGLTKTADEFDKLIEDQKKICSRYEIA